MNEYEERHVINHSAYDDRVDYGHIIRKNGKRYILEATLTEKELEGYAVYVAPTYRWDTDAAQQIMNGLWQAGFRPKDGEGTLAQTKATDSHLQDLRKLVSKAFNVKL